MKRETPEQFFYRCAGYSYDPKTQTPEEGRKECAAKLAHAERRGSDAGLSFEWAEDDIDSSSFRNDRDPYPLWLCVCRRMDGTAAASLGGVDFGRYCNPYGDSYRRVVEAELAMESLK